VKPRIIIALAVSAAVVAVALVAYGRSASPPATKAQAPAVNATETASVVASSTAVTGTVTTTVAAVLATAEDEPTVARESKRVPTGDSSAATSDGAGQKVSDAEDKSGGENENTDSDLRFGLTLEERKACYWESIEAEDRAVREAGEVYPIDADPRQKEEHYTLRMSLEATYQAELREKYSLTVRQMKLLMAEGAGAMWPMPDAAQPTSSSG